MDDRNVAHDGLSAAWDALYDSMPARWHVGMPAYDTAGAAWSVTAAGPGLAGYDATQSVTGRGATEAAALRDLDHRLRNLPRPNRARIDDVGHLLRMAYVDGAEAFSKETFDRGLTPAELARLIQRYEGRY